MMSKYRRRHQTGERKIVCKGYKVWKDALCRAVSFDDPAAKNWRRVKHPLICNMGRPVWLCPECIKKLPAYLFEARDRHLADLEREYKQKVLDIHRRYSESIEKLHLSGEGKE